jgi:hypothetical protein
LRYCELRLQKHSDSSEVLSTKVLSLGSGMPAIAEKKNEGCSEVCLSGPVLGYWNRWKSILGISTYSLSLKWGLWHFHYKIAVGVNVACIESTQPGVCI